MCFELYLLDTFFVVSVRFGCVWLNVMDVNVVSFFQSSGGYSRSYDSFWMEVHWTIRFGAMFVYATYNYIETVRCDKNAVGCCLLGFIFTLKGNFYLLLGTFAGWLMTFLGEVLWFHRHDGFFDFFVRYTFAQSYFQVCLLGGNWTNIYGCTSYLIG